MIHLSYLAYDKEGQLAADEDLLINNTLEIPEDMLKYHKLKLEDFEERGVDLNTALEKFKKIVDQADYIFSFNLNYNENVIGAEYLRQEMSHRLHQSEKYCLMQESTYFCKIINKEGGYKWPTLTELHVRCFDAGYIGVNNARSDVMAATKCFNHMWSEGQLDDLF
ncbi:hypothetical protein GCM10025777_03740 [Membranihabitans marinus]